MEKRYNFRIYPTKMQAVQIQKNFGCCRFVYNYFLAKHIEKYEAGEEFYGLYDACAELPALKRTKSYEWLREADAASLSYALCDLDNAYKAFFRNIKKGGAAPGFPRFKSKKDHRQSFRVKNKMPKYPRTIPPIEVGENAIKLPKLGWIDCSVSKKVEGRILSATVIQNPSGKYYVSVNCTDFAPKPLPRTGKATGLHFGIQNLAVTSNGQFFDNHRYLEKSRKKISRIQRQLSRKASGSKNREKARIKYARIFERITNQKTDALHKLTTQLIRDYDVIAIRDTSVDEMMRHPAMARYLADANWGDFTRKLSYKCSWYGKTLIKVGEAFPSAQLCSSCGFKNINVKRRGDWQEWTCPKCGVRHNRGVNSAINILNEGYAAIDSIKKYGRADRNLRLPRICKTANVL